MTTSNPYRDAIEATYPDLDLWKARASVERPERGSDLAIDDKVFGWFPISEAARMSLHAAGEHLRLTRDGILQRQLYPSAQFTVLRGALVGACQAVWILSPSEAADRQERGLTVIAELYRQLDIYYNSRVEYESLNAQELAHLRDQQDWLKERQSQVAQLRRGSGKLDLTNIVIAQALDHTFLERDKRETGRRLWREMSGDAHVLGWSQFQRATVGTTDRRTGIGELTTGGGWSDIAQPFVACHLLLKEGWSLFDRRCEAPSTHNR